MNNNYKFIDRLCGIIYQVTSPDRVIPKEGQIVTVGYKEYEVCMVDETINFDNFSRNITIYLNDLN